MMLDYVYIRVRGSAFSIIMVTIRTLETEAINQISVKCVEYYQRTNHYSSYYH